MDRIWAPWRGEYLQKVPDKGCFLCGIIKEDKDTDNFVLHRGQQALALLNLYPYNTGHLMVAPLRHVASLKDINREELDEIFYLCKVSEDCLSNYMKCEGINIGINLEKAAGAGLIDHLHIHVVPRWLGDTNFMPVIFDTKVLSMHLNQIYDRLLPAFRK